MTVFAFDDSAFAIGNSAPHIDFEIVAEQSCHIASREHLLDLQMGPGRRRKSSEILRRGRRPADGLAFVAVNSAGGLLGTVRLWNIAAGTDRENNVVPALLLGPLAVAAAIEGKGIGSQLMHHAIASAKALGHGAITLVGDARYYERFGFTAEYTGALAMPGPVERSRFLAIELVDGYLSGAAGVLTATGQLASMRRRARLAASCLKRRGCGGSPGATTFQISRLGGSECRDGCWSP